MNLFSDAHITEEQNRLYTIEDYSTGCLLILDALAEHIHENKIETILDYGAGLARPAELLKIEHPVQYYPYDPAIPEFSEIPTPKQFSMAINTLEHCEEAYIDQIIHHLASLTTHSTLITVNTVLLGGMPRSINRSDSWWVKRLAGAFNFSYFRRCGDGFTLIAEPLRKPLPQSKSDAHNIGQTPLANSAATT